MPRDLLKAVLLSEGTSHRVLIATGAPWGDTSYTILDGDDLYEDAEPPFLEADNVNDAYVAARRARFEFGETPIGPRLFTADLFERKSA